MMRSMTPNNLRPRAITAKSNNTSMNYYDNSITDYKERKTVGD